MTRQRNKWFFYWKYVNYRYTFLHKVPFLGIVPLYMIDVSADAAVLRLLFSGSVLSCMFTRRLEFFGGIFDVEIIISDVIILLPLLAEFDPLDTADELVEFDEAVEDVVDAAMWLLQGAVVYPDSVWCSAELSQFL